MNDVRVAAFRKTLNGLVESLDATVRVARWPGPEPVPAPLQDSASKLLDRLGSANRMAADRYQGPPPVVVCMTAMSTATKSLDAAYVEYRRHLSGSSADLDKAAMELDHEIDAVKATSAQWE